jgi:hypothetical protein
MSEELRLVEFTDRWELSHTDFVVTRCAIDYTFSILLLKGNSGITIGIANDFTFKANAKVSTISVANTKTLVEVLAILHKPLRDIKMYKTGQLELHIDGCEIIVAPDSKYEAWQIVSADKGVGNGGLLVVCIPDGDLAIWLPE